MNIISIKQYISLFLIIATCFFTQEMSYATPTINTSYILRDGGDPLISPRGTFELGFFSPQNSKNRYVGIWYKKIKVKTLVWVANRDNPLKDESGSLKVVEPGLLVLVSGTDAIMWSTNTSSNVQNPAAQLLDSGNLVVKDANDNNPENFLWQSSDYPTDTFLPGMKLGRSIPIPVDNCLVYNMCGPYGICMENSPPCKCLNKFKPKDPQGWDRGDWSKGCNRITPLNCQGDAFLKYSGIEWPDTQYHSWYNTSVTLDECKVLCLRNCSCTAYTSLDLSRGENGCLLWFGDLVHINEISPGPDIYIRMASSELGRARKKREILIVTLSLVVGVGIILLFLGLLLCYQKRKKLDNNHEDLELPLFELSKILKATDNFSISNILGQGGFGPVYKGVLDEGQEIAVKCLSRTSRQGVDEFKNEINCIAKLQHRNLVKLLGWCIRGEEMMLVYEYMANRSLDLILFDPTKRLLLDWPRRFNIINGIARGLMYLHQDSCLRVIHRDLKASNILLDSDMNPKISDFGLARTFGGNETEANTSRVVGTYGYMSPEYAVDGLFSVKSDVFSYGVIVLEIVNGNRNRGFHHSDHLLNLLGHAWILYREERSLELVDPCLRNSFHLAEVLRSIHIGLLCVQECPEDRPSMSSVVLMLSNDGVLPEAKRPGFFTARDTFNTLDSSKAASSKNTMSITLLEPR